MIIERPFDKKAISDLYNARPEEFQPTALDFILSDELNARNQIYCFYTDDLKTLLGVIYFTERDGNLYINGFSVPKNLRNIITALEIIIKFMDCDLYSNTTSKSAVFVLRKVGFEKISHNLYRRLK